MAKSANNSLVLLNGLSNNSPQHRQALLQVQKQFHCYWKLLHTENYTLYLPAYPLQFTWEKCTNEGITWQIITNSTSIVIMLLCNLCSISFNWYYMKWVFSPIINLTLEPVIKSEVSSFASVAYDADVLENYEFGKSALFIFEIDSKSVGTIEDYTSQIDAKNWNRSER